MSANRHIALFGTPWGQALVGWSSKGVSLFRLPQDNALDPSIMPAAYRRAEPTAPIRKLIENVNSYFAGEQVDFSSVQVDLTGSPAFHQRVYRRVQKIDFAKTRTYGEVAEAVGSPAAARAVGGAMRTNPIPLIIPCHRVLGSQGKLTGFSAAGGVATKQRMLDLEAAPVRGRRQFQIVPPKGFVLATTARSHGWYDLPPFKWDEARQALSWSAQFDAGQVARIEVTHPDTALVVDVCATQKIRVADLHAAQDSVFSVLRLDEDLAALYACARRDRKRDWIVKQGAGRLLRAPTAFEDLVKLLLTTNCSWAATRSMTANLLTALGTPVPGGYRLFPTAHQMATRTEKFYRQVVRAGYRADALVRLSRSVASGSLDIEGWRRPETRPTLDDVLAIHGVGPYSAGQMLRLLGDYSELAIDSWCRNRVREISGKPLTDKQIRKAYGSLGAVAGLVFWLDLTAGWHEQGVLAVS